MMRIFLPLVLFVSSVLSESMSTPTCGTNEVWQSCIGYCSFDPDCASEFKGIIRDCPPPPHTDEPPPCTGGCVCKPGFVRTQTGCKHPDVCCQGVNEVSVDCPSRCDDTCDGPAPFECQLTPCFNKGCRCRPAFVRNDFDMCVLQRRCRIDRNRMIRGRK